MGRSDGDWALISYTGKVEGEAEDAHPVHGEDSLVEVGGEGTVEGFNNKARVTTKRSYGFRSYDLLELALYQTLGDLPEPKVTHRFCG